MKRTIMVNGIQYVQTGTSVRVIDTCNKSAKPHNITVYPWQNSETGDQIVTLSRHPKPGDQVRVYTPNGFVPSPYKIQETTQAANTLLFSYVLRRGPKDL